MTEIKNKGNHHIIAMVLSAFLLSSINAHAQCDFETADPIIITQSGSVGSFLNFYLVDKDGLIVEVSNSGTFAAAAKGAYKVYAINFDGTAPSAGLTTGAAYAPVGGCFSEAEHTITVCDEEPDLFVCLGADIVVVNDPDLKQDYTTAYVLVNAAGNVVGIEDDSAPSAVFSGQPEGEYVVHAINYDSGEPFSNSNITMGAAYPSPLGFVSGCYEDITEDAGINSPDIVTTMVGATGTCESNMVNGFVHLFDVNGNIIASVNDNGQTLGDVTVTLPNTVIGGATASGVCSGGLNAFMERYFLFTSTVDPTADVTVRLYFTAAELAALIAASHTTNTAPASDPNGCEDDDDVNTIADIISTLYPTGNGPGGTGDVLSQDGNGFDTEFDAHYVDFTVTAFDEDIYLHGSEHGAPLPVEMISFTATPKDNEYVSLDWKTATEINNKGFDVERSLDGENFSKIDYVEGNGNTNSIKTYNLLDRNVQENVLYYYRLKQVDFDGMYEYTNIVSARIIGQGGYAEIQNIYPNPTTSLVYGYITFFGENTTVQIDVYNVVGAKVSSRSDVVNTGDNKILLNNSKLASGSYLIKVNINDRITTHKLTVIK